MLTKAINGIIASALEPCDDFIFISGIILEAAIAARSKYGARLWVERGSRHILSQNYILSQIPGASTPNASTISREEACYNIADRIVIPSQQVKESFSPFSELSEKLFVNPYGVDIKQFTASNIKEANRPPTVVTTGLWSLRKGSDTLTDAIKTLENVQLVHIGPLGDFPFPDHPRFLHHGPVEQSDLVHYYRSADLFALASREEGLALVQAQALASGIPIVCTDRTGGADLGHSPALAGRIKVVPHDNSSALAVAISTMLRNVADHDLPRLSDDDLNMLSWRAYALRYSREIEQPTVCEQKCPHFGL